MTPAAMRATRALQKENGRRLLAGEEFLSQEEIAELIDRETMLPEIMKALEDTTKALDAHARPSFKMAAESVGRYVVEKMKAR